MIIEAPKINATDPAPGVYPDMPAAAYHALDAASASRLNKLVRSPAHCRHAIDNPGEQTAALAFGEAFHLCCLQPDLFRDRYVTAPDVDRRTKQGKADWLAFQAENAGREIIAIDDMDRCYAMADAIRAHPAASALLDARTDTELSAVWTCRTTGVRCKLRADALTEFNTVPVVMDLKTTENASRPAFERSIFTYGYFRQAAHYLAGLAAIDRIYESFCIIAAEKQPPHAVAVYRLQDDILAAGHEEVIRLLKTYGECRRTGCWGGYGDGFQDIAIPRWAFREIEGNSTNGEGSYL